MHNSRLLRRQRLFRGATLRVLGAMIFASLGLPWLRGQLVRPAQRAEVADGLLHQRWTAKWITSPDVPARAPAVLHFRKSIHLEGAPGSFIVNVSADNRFVLFVNGIRVADGPARGDLFHWRFETIEIAPFLKAGDNVLAATVWNFGAHSPIGQMTNRTGFLLQGNSAAEAAANTDASWQVEVERGDGRLPSGLRELGYNYFAAGPGELLDATQYDWNWMDPSQSSGERWRAAVAIGAGSPRGIQDAPDRWFLVPDKLPPMSMTLTSPGEVRRSSGIQPPPEFPEQAMTVPAQTHASILLDTRALQTAYPELEVSGGAGATVRLTYAEALVSDHGQKGNRDDIADKHIAGYQDEYRADGGRDRVFTPLWWRTWRYLQLDIETAGEPLTIEHLRAYATQFPFVVKARFVANEPRLARVWQTGWRTASLCAHETYMDCPYWEQLQYVGDTRIQALISYVMTGDDRLARQAIEALNFSRLPDGITQSRYPSELPQMIPPFSLMWVGMVRDFWQYRGDAEFTRGQLEGTRTVLDWFLTYQRADGMLRRLPWWDFVDWTSGFRDGVPPQDADGGAAALTLQFVGALRDAADLETALGDAGRAALYRRRADRAAAAVYRECWRPKRGLIADTPAGNSFSQEANALAVWLDAVPRAEQRRVMTNTLALDGKPDGASLASYYFRFYLFRALDHAGMADDYLSLLDPWYRMLDLGLTTWAETPEPTRSDCHAWSAHPNYDLLTLVAGIRPATPGFRSVLIEPHPGDLHDFDAALPARGGLIEVAYARGARRREITVTLPANIGGVMRWKGRDYRLHSGRQTLELPVETGGGKSGRRPSAGA